MKILSAINSYINADLNNFINSPGGRKYYMTNIDRPRSNRSTGIQWTMLANNTGVTP